MPRTCSVCHHPKRAEIDRVLLAETDPLRTIADRWSVSKTALIRHRKDHLSERLVKAQDAKEVANADDLLSQVRELRSKSLELLTLAEQAGDIRTALQGVREARACVELLLEVEGELDRRSTVNILIAPQWLEARGVIMSALQGHPDASQRVAEALQSIEGHRS